MRPSQIILDFDSLDDEVKWNAIKSFRNDFLFKSDWTQLVDVSLSLESRLAWQNYRQSLRDITKAFTNPDDVIFPDLPDAAISTSATIEEQLEAAKLMIDLLLTDTQEAV